MQRPHRRLGSPAFSGFLALLMFVPLINVIMLYFLAFARWNVVPVTAVYPAPPVPYRPPV